MPDQSLKTKPFSDERGSGLALATATRSPSDLLAEDVVSLNEARAILPDRPSVQKLHRLRMRGILVGGVRVKLESFRSGARIFTSRQACRRFIDRLSKPGDARAAVTSGERRSAHRSAVESLTAEGF